MVRDGVDGVLVDPSNVQDWAEKLTELSRDVFLVKRLRANVRPPRTMQSVANDMRELYLRVLNGTPATAKRTAQCSAPVRHVADGDERVFAFEHGTDRYGEWKRRRIE